ncbi:glycoside hydrolase family 35 protein [Virgibacillus siamensis]|uniref:glycoside hydrolase family 35 protein n=1 Tax=Virgibacillus siamensis TaxID=480071 RepID=UPI000985FD4C|nr:beta-galactosidase [Virgibacillus siamensis]
MAKLTVHNGELIYDGEAIQLISGAIHYTRVVPEYWEDRLLKLNACGFNTVETYIPWNVHEPKPGNFNFSGMADVVKFIKTAGELGLFVIIRPSPYICAEWEFGGLPAWLLADSNMQVRSSDPKFLNRVDLYYDVLMEKLKPYLSTNGGPIIAMQIENEYGSYGSDKKYLTYLKDAMTTRGIDVLLFTSDGPTDEMLQGGTLPDVLAAVNFGSRPNESFAQLKKHRPNSPLFCMEYWNGWFDHWGEKHHTRDDQDVAEVFAEMLDCGASVNFYMFHGGTNFGFYNGANFDTIYRPTITSYDYDSLLTEAGDITPKFHAVREVIAGKRDVNDLKLPEPIKKKGFGAVSLDQSVSLFHALKNITNPIERTHPEPMEKLGQNFGFILYRTIVSGPISNAALYIDAVHDRALVFVNGNFLDVIERWENQQLIIDIPPGGAEIDILVENMGRINYGSKLADSKGITKGVQLNGEFLYNWTIFPLPLNDLSAITYEFGKVKTAPGFYKGTFQVDETADTFLELPGWTKGAAFLNGFNLGRYWNIGPQQTLYIPAPLLKTGVNELVIFELHGMEKPMVRLRDSAILG